MSKQRGKDQLSLNIDRMIRELSHAPSNPCINRVSHFIRSTNIKAFDPMIISIGPFHHGKDHLKDMENLKLSYLKKLFGESSVDEYVYAIRGNEQAARDCYAEKIPLKSDDFVQMLLLDGIFIIEFFRRVFTMNKGPGSLIGSFDSHLSRFGQVADFIYHDLLLFENQIPMLVIDILFNLLKKHNHHDRQKFSDLIWPSSEEMFQGIKCDHLLGLFHYAATLSFSKNLSSIAGSNFNIENIYSASELKEAGVVFKKVKVDETSSWLDIKFENKTIYFPELEIGDETESLMKNMTAYEQCRPYGESKYFTDYAFFLNCLVQSSKDAELLRHSGILKNWLGGDDRVYEMIQGLGTNAQPSEKFLYLGVFRSVNLHCRHRRNRWIAVLRTNHFDNPWTTISLVAAVVLLSVAILQTVYTILSYYRDSSAAPSNPS